jgi:hypothetical protein
VADSYVETRSFGYFGEKIFRNLASGESKSYDSRSPILGSSRSSPHYPGSDLGARTEPQLAQRLADVVLDGALGYPEFLRYPAVSEPLPDEDRHLVLAAGEGGGILRAVPRAGCRRGVLRTESVLDGLAQGEGAPLTSRRLKRPFIQPGAHGSEVALVVVSELAAE